MTARADPGCEGRRVEAEIWPVEVGRSQIVQVVLDLLRNAAQAMPDGGRFTARTRDVELDVAQAETLGPKPGPHVELGKMPTLAVTVTLPDGRSRHGAAVVQLGDWR